MIMHKNWRIHFNISNLILCIVAIIILVIVLFPIWWTFNIVFSPAGVPVSVNPRLYPASLSSGIKNIQDVISRNNYEYLVAYKNTFLYTIFEIIGVLILCSLGAYEFALFNFPGKRILYSLILLALMIPFVVTLVPTYLLVSDFGWVNQMQGLVIPGIASAFGLFMLTQFFQDIPREIIDAALIDGASHFGVYRYVVIPLSTNALVTLAIITFIHTWGNFIWPLVIATKTDIFTIGQIINRYNGEHTTTTINMIMTANLLAAVPPLLFFMFFQSKIIQGMSMSGLKG